jgi:diamine N-acetyltransferase
MDSIVCRKLTPEDIDALVNYLSQLSPETKSRFGPHAYDKAAVENFYRDNTDVTGYIAETNSPKQIIAYSLIKNGCLWHDYDRIKNYGFQINAEECCTFAPSVADEWQSKGIGKMLFNFILADINNSGIKKMILWGGVQASNERAVNFYTKAGFRSLGMFEYNGSNLDMMLEIA